MQYYPQDPNCSRGWMVPRGDTLVVTSTPARSEKIKMMPPWMFFSDFMFFLTTVSSCYARAAQQLLIKHCSITGEPPPIKYDTPLNMIPLNSLSLGCCVRLMDAAIAISRRLFPSFPPSQVPAGGGGGDCCTVNTSLWFLAAPKWLAWSGASAHQGYYRT